MLDKKDIEQIRGVVQTEIRSELKDEFGKFRTEIRSELKDEFGKFRTEIRSELKDEFGKFRTEIRSELKEELKPIKSDLAKANRNIDALIDFFDNENLSLRSRVERIENVLHLQPLKSNLQL